MNITIVGAGNIGTQFAAHCAENGHKVVVYGSKPEKINKLLTVVNEENEIIHRGIIEKATDDEKEAFSNADLIFVTMPATLMRLNAQKIEPFVKPGLKICIVPGTGGGECAFYGCIKKGATVFGVQRVPSVARLIEYGNTVKAIGYRDEMFVAAIPHKETGECCKIIESIIGVKTTPLPNYLNITLTPSNPILHTTRLRNLYGDWKEGVVYKKVPLFYENWNNETSELLIACDTEVQQLCKTLPFNLSYVKSLCVHYESPTAEAMTKKISGITGFKGLTSPTKKVEGGYIPDFNSRYFTADFSYGLVILIQIAEYVNIDVPNMRETLQGIEVRLNTDYLENKKELDAIADKVVYTGPIDAYFGYTLGTLEYRSVRFEIETLDKPNFQGNAAVNYTDRETPWTRIIEHKWFEFGKDEEGNDLPKTVISREFSSEWKPGDEPYYPVNDEKNSALYGKYKELTEKEEKVIFGGRLGEYKYYDMDQVIAAALHCCDQELH